ncbi:Rieske 2Fe-2S domain-containing protein [Pseudonocardia dioxanivorans]|uniref:Rieske 2Fe-2S domain-containing protein n=1 Tax=Pseudonocardia dioxanivorans TaxID=240495 RepID=UPI000CD22E9E|nr:Rieske 2Fe-2S domain-containing protein [Pseudonocardia dioxanivorans]
MSQQPPPRFRQVCAADDLWAGEMKEFTVGGTTIVLLRTDDESIRAVQYVCPHQDYPLREGYFDGCTLTCAAHLWEFDAQTGRSINPDDAKLALYPVEERDGIVYVAVEGIDPYHSHA